MLARTYGPKYDKFPCLLQPKLNGIRALAQSAGASIVMQSRDEKLWRYDFLREIYDELKVLYASAKTFFGNTWTPLLDGELYVHGWRLQDINAAIAVNRKERTDNTGRVEYHIFDSIPNLTSSFLDRWVGLSSLIQQLRNDDALPHIRVVPTHRCDNLEEMLRYFHHYTAAGYEGVMLRTDEPYFLGETDHGTEYRSRTLWKHKQWEDAEFLCVGTTPGEGKASIGIGALILDSGQPCDLNTTPLGSRIEASHFKVGTGFSDEDRIFYAANPPIGKLVRVRYLELTAAGIPFNPSFLAVLE